MPLLTRRQRLMLTIVISFSFFLTEIIAGFYTHSLALVADAFHYLSDLIGFIVALVALMVSERTQPAPRGFTFGWQRATLLGAFFNGVFLLALGVSVLVQAIERFINVHEIEKPTIVLIVGCVGLGLNVLAMSFLHEHDHGSGDGHVHAHAHGHSHSHSHAHSHAHGHTHGHGAGHEEAGITVAVNGAQVEIETRPSSESNSHHNHKHVAGKATKPGRDLGMLGVLIHVIGDALNNIGVIISALIIWKAKGENRYYADPAVGAFIAVMIFLTAVPLVKRAGSILLQIAPEGIDLDDVRHDMEKIPGIESVHELHVWRLDQHKSIASAHVVVDGRTVKSFTEKAKIIMECLHAYGIHSATLQPEMDPVGESQSVSVPGGSGTATPTREKTNQSSCQLVCGELCGEMRCCSPEETS